MRSFCIALLVLLIISYWCHLLVTREMESNEIVPVIIDNTVITSGICECRCCLLSGTICESIIRHSISFRKDFSCQLCTNKFCAMNSSEMRQCQWKYTMRADCFQHKHRQKPSLIHIRPILQ